MSLIGQKPWFRAKRFGFGAGAPIAWQGWAALALFVAGVAVASARLHGGARWLAVATLILVFAAVAAVKTEGGWRWRNGG